MIEQLLTRTRILSFDTLSPEELDRIIFYLAGGDAPVAVICDNRPDPARDNMIAGLASYRKVHCMNDVRPDPKSPDIMKMCRMLDGSGVKAVIGIGGGSTMDSAKAVAAVLGNGGDLDDYLGNDPVLTIEKKEIKLILIPTTAGTGAEVTKVGVYTSRSGRKYTLGSPMLQADVAILVTACVKDLPRHLIASTGFDALSHALETIWNRNATPETDRAAVESAVLIMKNLEKAYDGDQEAVKQMQTGACMAGISFSHTGTAMVHAISFILSEEWHVPHGTACSFTLEDALDFNLQDRRTSMLLAEIGRRIYGDGEERTLISMFRQDMVSLKMKMGLPSVFGDLGIQVSRDDVPALFKRSMDDPKMKNNVIPVDFPSVCSIIKSKI